MALKNISEIDMIQGPEFVNLQPLDVNPLMSKCEIKVLYLGHNRNGSYINKETALKMAKTLRGTPIVAAFNEDKGDFSDHGHIMHIEDGEVTFSCKTIPYGFVSPDAKVWFSNFTDKDEFDNQVERTYLMTTGYLWTGQFEEISKVIKEGQPQSMELDSETLNGHWATDNNLGVDFFIINDATFSKLCVLGDDVEPCFEGSSITSPEVSKDFSSSSNFQHTLFTMMNDLQQALKNEGGLNMSEETLNNSVEEENSESTEEYTEEVVETTEVVEEPESTEDFVDQKKKDDDDDDSDAEPEDKDDDSADDKDDVEDEDEDDKKKPQTNHTLEEFEQMQAELNSLRAENEELRAFKLNVENQQKQALIDSYYMLSDEDKADVVAHKAEYTMDEIKAKLAVIYVEKNVNFDVIDGQEEQEVEETPAITFSLDDEGAGVAPEYVELLRQIKNN